MAGCRGYGCRGEYVNDDDVVEIARTTFSDLAREEADFIFRSMAGIRARYGLRARLPFEGHTQLVVRGIPFQVLLGSTFLAFVIESCTGPMPFRHLIFERDNEPNPILPDDVTEDYRRLGSVGAAPPWSERASYTQQSNPNSEERATMLEGLLNSDRYKTDYKGTRISGKTAHPVEYEPASADEEREQPPELEDFWHAIDELKARHLDVEVRRIGTYPFPVGSVAKGEASRRRTWPFIDGRNRRIRRHAAIAIALEKSAGARARRDREKALPSRRGSGILPDDYLHRRSLALAREK